MNYQGSDGLIWWQGVVEDRNDPLFLNRVRVRIYGAHTWDKTKIATPDLPWAEVMMPTTSPSTSGLGTTTHGLVEGSSVLGFYRDGLESQDPVVMGSFIGIPQDFYRIDETIDDDGTHRYTKVARKTTEGFNDPRLDTEASYKDTTDGANPEHIQRNYGLTLALDKSPRRAGESAGEIYPKSSYVNTTDVNTLATGTEIEEAYPKVAEVDGEPDRSNYVKPTYPFNHVHETESGHVIELDDTPDYERIHAHHRTGTRIEVDKDGTYIEKIVRDKYTLILGSDTVKIQGAVDIEVGESLASDAIAAGGGSTTITNTASEGIVDEETNDIVDEEGKLTEQVVSKLKQDGATTEEITEIEEIIVTAEKRKATGEKTLGDKIKDAAKEGLDAYDDIKNNAKFQTAVNVVEGINQGGTGYLAVLDEIENHIGTELNSDARDVLTDVLSGADFKDVAVSKGISIAKEKLTAVIKESAVVQAIEAKLDSVVTAAAASIEGMEAIVAEKVGAAVTSVLGEEVGAKAAAAISGQMVSAVSGLAMGAVMGAISSALVNVNIGGAAKVTTKGSTTLYSYGSTSVTSLMSTSITTLTGNTSLTTLLGNTTITNVVGNITATATAGTINAIAPAGIITATAPVIQATATGAVSVMAEGAISLTAPNIFSTGIWTHTGAMNITGATTITGATVMTGVASVSGVLTASTSVVTPIITAATHGGAIAAHTHAILSGSSAGTSGPPVP